MFNLFDFNLMANTSRELLKEIELLKKDNAMLQQQLKAAKDSFDAIKSGNIDALVIAHEKAIKVYTEKTADKPYRILIEKCMRVQLHFMKMEQFYIAIHLLQIW